MSTKPIICQCSSVSPGFLWRTLSFLVEFWQAWSCVAFHGHSHWLQECNVTIVSRRYCFALVLYKFQLFQILYPMNHLWKRHDIDVSFGFDVKCSDQLKRLNTWSQFLMWPLSNWGCWIPRELSLELIAWMSFESHLCFLALWAVKKAPAVKLISVAMVSIPQWTGPHWIMGQNKPFFPFVAS